MEKTIKIDGKEIRLRATAFNAVIYRREFGEDIMKSISPLLKASDGKNINFDAIEMETIMKLVWVMAKTSDNSLKPYDEWVSELESFPFFDILNDTYELILANLTSTTTIKNAKAAVNSQRKA